jgi:hypothetical protein
MSIVEIVEIVLMDGKPIVAWGVTPTTHEDRVNVIMRGWYGIVNVDKQTYVLPERLIQVERSLLLTELRIGYRLLKETHRGEPPTL